MTVTEEFISSQEDQELEAAPNYPTAFGVTLTPSVIGVLVAVLGLAGTLYLLFNQVMPLWQKSQELQSSRNEKQAQVQQKQASLAQNAKVKLEQAQAKQQQLDVLALFANEKTLDTLLIDINRLVESSNTKLAGQARAKLTRFVPVNQSAEVITDGSLGSEVNGKLKSQVVNIDLEGSFAQTQSIIRNIERLQPLLLINNFQATLVQTPSDKEGKVVRGPMTINTSFQLQALIPASPEEVANTAAPEDSQKQ